MAEWNSANNQYRHGHQRSSSPPRRATSAQNFLCFITTSALAFHNVEQGWAWCPQYRNSIPCRKKATLQRQPGRYYSSAPKYCPHLFGSADNQNDTLLVELSEPQENPELAVLEIAQEMERQYRYLARELNMDADRIMDEAETTTRTALSDLDFALWKFTQAYQSLANSHNNNNNNNNTSGTQRKQSLWIAQERKLETQIQELSIQVLLAYSKLEEGITRFHASAMIPTPTAGEIRRILHGTEDHHDDSHDTKNNHHKKRQQQRPPPPQLLQQEPSSFTDFVFRRVKEDIVQLQQDTNQSPLDDLDSESLQLTSQRALDMVLHFGNELLVVIEAKLKAIDATKTENQQQQNKQYIDNMLTKQRRKETQEEMLDAATSNDSISALETAITDMKEQILRSLQNEADMNLTAAEWATLMAQPRSKRTVKSTLTDLSSLHFRKNAMSASESTAAQELEQQQNKASADLQAMIAQVNTSIAQSTSISSDSKRVVASPTKRKKALNATSTTTEQAVKPKKSKPSSSLAKNQKPVSIWSKLNIPSKRPAPVWPKRDWSSSSTISPHPEESPTEFRKRILWSSLIQDLDTAETIVVPQNALIWRKNQTSVAVGARKLRDINEASLL